MNNPVPDEVMQAFVEAWDTPGGSRRVLCYASSKLKQLFSMTPEQVEAYFERKNDANS